MAGMRCRARPGSSYSLCPLRDSVRMRRDRAKVGAVANKDLAGYPIRICLSVDAFVKTPASVLGGESIMLCCLLSVGLPAARSLPLSALRWHGHRHLEMWWS